MFALDQTLSTLSHVQKRFGPFLLRKAMGVCCGAEAEATTLKAAVMGGRARGCSGVSSAAPL